MDTIPSTYRVHSATDSLKKDPMQALLNLHKERYVSQYKDIQGTSISVHRLDSRNAIDFDFPRPLAFLDGYSQRKQFVAVGSNINSFCDYVAYLWASEKDLAAFNWLVRIKASNIQGSIDNAIYKHVIHSHVNTNQPPAKEDILEDIKQNYLLLVEGDTNEVPSSLDNSFKTVNNIVLITESNSTIQKQIVQNTRGTQLVYFNINSIDIKGELERDRCSEPTQSAPKCVLYDTFSRESTQPLSLKIIREIYIDVIQNEFINEEKPPAHKSKEVSYFYKTEEDYPIITENVNFIGLHSEFLLNSTGLPLRPEESNISTNSENSSGYSSDNGEEQVTKREVVEMLYTLHSSSDDSETTAARKESMSHEGSESVHAELGAPAGVHPGASAAASARAPAGVHPGASAAASARAPAATTIMAGGAYDDAVLETLCDSLSLQENWPAEFEGMYVEEGNIVIDVLKGGTPQMKQFLFDHCRTIFAEQEIEPRKAVVFVEQTEQAEYCVKRGSTICNIPDKEAFHKVISSSDIRGIACIQEACSQPEQPHQQPYGTVACVSEKTSEGRPTTLVLLTARHVFERNIADIEETLVGDSKCNYFCENKGKLDYIAEESYGIFGGSKDGNKGVDISVIPISAHEVPQGASAKSYPIPKVYDGPPNKLLDRLVEKLGATTTYSSGYICKTNYRAKIGPQPRSECILVLTDDSSKTDTFSKPGDSGALVVSRQSDPMEAIGLITKTCKGWTNKKGSREDATIVVLLKNCLDAIESESGFKLQLCGVWEECCAKPLPKPADARVPSPHLSSASVNDVKT